jgi:hypothetical protein
MKAIILIQKYLTAILLIVITAEPTYSGQQQKQTSIDFQCFRPSPGFNRARLNALAEAVDFKQWPQTETRRVAPRIDKSLLTRPDLATRESISHCPIEFNQAPRRMLSWSCQRHVKTNEPLPTELPAERKAKLLEHLSAEIRKDPNLVERYLRRKLDRYRRSKEYHSLGEMDVEVCLSPSSRAAQEYMLAMMIESTMPTASMVGMYAGAKRPQGLGDISFLTEFRTKDSRIRFVRDNVYLRIWGTGCFAEEVLPLARKIDSMLVGQPPLTYEQLLARRPSIIIAPEAEKDKTGEKTVSYNISAPAGQEIVDLKAYVDDQSAPVRDGKIHIIRKTGKVKAKVVATTSELLTSSVERQVIVAQ